MNDFSRPESLSSLGLAGLILHLYDGTGWSLDVPISVEQWALYKRMARRRKMKVAAWVAMALHEGLTLLEAKAKK